MQVDIHRILCPVDLSPASAWTLHRAEALARWYDAELLVLHVVPVSVPAAALAPAGPAEPAGDSVAQEGMREEVRAFIAVEVGVRPSILPLVSVGPTAATVVDVARQRSVDLIVVGTRGQGGLRRAVLGSVAEGVQRHAPCPVLTVPSGASQSGTGAPAFARIVCAVDFSEASLAGLEHALALARTADASLVLLHVVQDALDSARAPWSPGEPESRATLEQDARHRLARLVPADAADWCRVRTRVAEGEAGREILRAAAEVSADLIVLGVEERNRVSLLLGSTAHDVLQHAPCPVLTVCRRPGQ